MGMLEGKNILITGVLTDASLGFGVAKLCIEEGAQVVLTGAGKAKRVTARTAKKLPGGDELTVLEYDVTQPEQRQGVADFIVEEFGGVLHGALHSIGYMTEPAMKGDFMEATWEDVAAGYQISLFSLQQLAGLVMPFMHGEGDIVALDFDNSSVAWPAYNHMGPAKAGLQAMMRSLARELGPIGIRVNNVAAGPIRTMAAKAISGFEQFEEVWSERAPLGWDVTDSSPVAEMCMLMLAGRMRATTGAVIPVDGGYSSVGA